MINMPLFIDNQDHMRPAAPPAVVVAIGEHGRQVLATLSQAAAVRPGLLRAVGGR